MKVKVGRIQSKLNGVAKKLEKFSKYEPKTEKQIASVEAQLSKLAQNASNATAELFAESKRLAAKTSPAPMGI